MDVRTHPLTAPEWSGPRHVGSADGTTIAVWSAGSGLPLVLVHGAVSDHTRWRPLLPYLVPHRTVHAIDRRGRGASGDGPTYDLEREVDDVLAVIEWVAEASSSDVDLNGHSFGGAVSMTAAPRATRMRRLILFEGWPAREPERHGLPASARPEMERLLAEDDGEGMLMTFLRSVLRLEEPTIDAMRAQPSWPGRVAGARRVLRELGAYSGRPFDPAEAAGIRVPTLLVVGSATTDPALADVDAVAAAIPDARIAVMPDQGHIADVLAPDVYASHVLPFLLGDDGQTTATR